MGLLYIMAEALHARNSRVLRAKSISEGSDTQELPEKQIHCHEVELDDIIKEAKLLALEYQKYENLRKAAGESKLSNLTIGDVYPENLFQIKGLEGEILENQAKLLRKIQCKTRTTEQLKKLKKFVKTKKLLKPIEQVSILTLEDVLGLIPDTPEFNNALKPKGGKSRKNNRKTRRQRKTRRY